MKLKRRDFFTCAAAFGATKIIQGNPSSDELAAKIDKILASPVLERGLFKEPLKISGIELLHNGRNFFVIVRTTEGMTGISAAHPDATVTTYPILLKRVAPSFLGKDARNLERVLEEVYLKDDNYKWQGLPFWVCVAAVELAVLDLLGKAASKPVGDLFGGVIHRDVGVYRASGNRGNTPEQEIEYLKKIVAEIGAKAIKFRLGGRMMFNDETTRRDLALIPLTRRTFGPSMTIYADANGSYDVAKAIKIGRVMEEHQLAFFEEPVPFDHYEDARRVARALKIPIALGEQENSLWHFRWIIETGLVRVVQPDIFYFGGMIRSIQVARMAAAAGLICTPHMSGGGLGYLYNLHFASCVPNAGAHQEFKGFDINLPLHSDSSPLSAQNGTIRVPSGPGWGVVIDPEFLKKADRVTV